MISTSLYPDGLTYASPSGTNVVSLPFNQLTDYPTIDTGSYYLGWISSDDLPVFSRMCDVEDLGEGVFRFYDTTDADNFPVGYVVTNNYDDSTATFLENDEIPKNAGGTYSTLYNDYRFINQLYPVDSAFKFTGNTSLGFYAFVHGESGVVRTYLSDIKHNGADITTITELLKLLKYPDYEITATVGNYGTITFTAADWDSGFPDMFTTSTGANVRLFFITFAFLGDYYIKNASSGTTTIRIRPFVRATAGNTSYHKTLCYPAISGSIDIARVDRWGQFSWRSYSTGGSFKKISAGMSGTVDTSTVTSTTGYTFDGNVLAYYNDRNIDICPILTLADLRKCFAMQFRIDTRPTTLSYVNGVTFATHVTGAEKFTMTYKTGDLEDTAYRNTLRPWQYENFQENEFDGDDVPPYTPGPGPSPRPEPEPPGDDEHGGDDITLPSIDGLGGSFGFTTQYALRGTQLEELGALLWSGFDSTNPNIDAYLQNFVYRVDLNTGSVNMSDIMDFFVSLRAYPLPLGNLVSVTAAGNDFYIGSGAQPLTFTSILHTANSYLSEVDAGSVTIPFWFGDYRDYSTEITLYLPYCGTAELNAADVMGGTLTATYVVDLSTGSCTAYVMCETYDAHSYPVAILPGQLGVDIPITASNAGRVGARLLGDRINVAENLLSVAKYGATGIGALMSGNVAGAIRSGISAFIDPAIQDQKLLAGMAERGAIAAPMLSGGRGLAGFKNPMTAYVQVRSPFYAVPDNFADAVGDPAAMYVQIGSCSGFCRFVNVDVTGVTTDAGDQAEIRRALENGVFV